jgi:hypothetical protein
VHASRFIRHLQDNLLDPSTRINHVVYITLALTTSKPCVLNTECIYGFRIVLRMKSDYFPRRLWPTSLCNGAELCFPWCRDWIFKRYLDELRIQRFKVRFEDLLSTHTEGDVSVRFFIIETQCRTLPIVWGIFDIHDVSVVSYIFSSGNQLSLYWHFSPVLSVTSVVWWLA